RILGGPNWSNEGDENPVDINGPAPGGEITNTDYSASGVDGDVVDRDPRTISNLVADQTLKNPAAIMAALKYAGFEGTGAEILAVVDQIQGLHLDYVTAATGGADASTQLATLN